MHEPTDVNRQKVEDHAKFGVNQDDIADELGITPNTLRKHYLADWKRGKRKAHTAVVGHLFKYASGDAITDKKIMAKPADCVRACIYWTKSQMGWKEGVDITVNSDDVGTNKPAEQATLKQNSENVVLIREHLEKLKEKAPDDAETSRQSNEG